MIAGIAWIGSSFYFIALDNHLRAARRSARRRGRRRRRDVGDPRRRLLQHREVPRRAARAAGDAALVQVGGIHDVAERLRAHGRPLLPQRRHVPDRQERRRPLDRRGGRDQRRRCSPLAWIVYDLLCRVLASRRCSSQRCCSALITLAAWGVGTPLQRRAPLSSGRRDDRDDDGRQRLLRDHPGALGARAREGGGARAGPGAGTRAASSARCTTTT